MAIGLAMTLLVPLRSVILSGDAAYPSSVAIAPVDWRVTPVQATADRRALWTSSSSFSAVLSERYSVVLPVVLGLIASSCAIAWPRSNRRTDVPQAAWVYAILGLACAAGAAVWWNEAAASRCAGAYFWIAGSCAIVWSSERAAHVDAWPRRWLVLLGLAIALLEPAGRAAGAIAHGRFADVVDMIWLMPGRRYLPEVPEFGVPRRTQSGLLVYEAFTIGYDSPLPNTPDFNPDLEQRRRGDLGSGFRVRAPANTAPAGNARD
jgi:hypothetical protein